LPVEVPQSLQNVVDADWIAPAGCATQRRSGFDRAGVGRPRGEDRALFVDREVRVGNDVTWVFERLRRVEQASRSNEVAGMGRSPGFFIATSS